MTDKGVTLVEQLTGTPEGMRLFQQERAIFELTELVCELMAEQGVSRTALASKLGKTKSYVTQLLDGRTNMTVRTASDLLHVLGRALHFREGSLVNSGESITISMSWPQPSEEEMVRDAPRWSSALNPRMSAACKLSRIAG